MEKNEACIYFVTNHLEELKYVGRSVNKLKDRWRTSPAYDAKKNSLKRKELYHSQCWPKICSEYNNGYFQGYTVKVLHGNELLNILKEIKNPISNIVAVDDGEIVALAMESWFLKHMKNEMWNKRK